MSRDSSSSEFCAALLLYLGGGAAEPYQPGEAGGGKGRIREAYPDRADALIAEIDALLMSVRSLPGLWGDGAPSLGVACEEIARFLEAEYPFVPATLRTKVVNAFSYELWK